MKFLIYELVNLNQRIVCIKIKMPQTTWFWILAFDNFQAQETIH